MGWLRDLMKLCSPPIEGYGELARRTLAHPEWPPDTHPQARSLAALFSKLDRNVELEWLADRDSVQRCLSLVLGCPIEVVRRAAAPGPEGPGHGRVRFDDLPYARPFDWREEPLPPGIPERVLSPAAWGRLWWLAPSGSGRSLVGQWLAARGLARFLRTESWSGILDRLPGTVPLYLEIEGTEDVAGLVARLPDGAVCVAASLPPPAGAGGAPWTLITSPPLDRVLTRLLAWIEARVPRDGSFEAVAAEAWLRPSLAAGELPTLGAVLGAAGLLDARGLREARGKSLAELAEPFVNERLARASIGGSEEAQWLKRFGFGALIQLAQNALTSSELPWTLARSQDEWIALVPADLTTTTTTAGGDRALGSVARPGSEGPHAAPSTPRAAPPGAYRIVRALIDADLLAERAPGRLAISPEFLKHAALARAREALVHHASAFDWGEALLRPHAAPAILDALYRRFADDDFGAIETLAELDAASTPALVVATEACLVCSGLRALCGAEIPTEYLEALWNEQLGWLVQLPGELPQPRLLCSTASDTSPIGHHAIWMLALLAVSELLGERQGRAHPLLRPWGAQRAPEALRPMLDAIYETLASAEVAECEWAVEAFALVGRLLEPGAAGDRQSTHEDEPAPVPDSAPPHPLARPARLAQALLDGDLDSRWLRGFGTHPLELRALSAACVLYRIAWPRMAHALWKNWQSRGCPADNDGLFAPDAAHAAEFWPHLPPEVLGTAWVRWTNAPTWPFACFGPTQWSAFVDYFADRWRRAAGSRVWHAAFQHMDLAHAERALERGQLLQAPEPELGSLIASLWQRFPGSLLTRLRERAAAGDAVAVTRLLVTAPVGVETEVVHALAEELSRRSTQRHVIDGARAWLFAKVAARRGDWRSAYALLVELERRLGRAERARGAPAWELEH